MKVLILIAVCVGLAACEHCTETNSCKHTSCDSSSQLHCVNNFCTCTVATHWGCTDVTTCYSINAWNCPQSRRHCIDQRCRCTQL